MPAPTPSRRERLRTSTLDEIREHALAQLATGGVEAVSLNAIARAMGMSGPALYRYFDSRDALLASLAVDAYTELADALAAAASAARRRTPERRLRALAEALRTWGLANRERYRLAFRSTAGSGAIDPDHVIPAAHRAMTTLLAALADLDPDRPPPAPQDRRLARELSRWGRSRGEGDDLPPGLLLLGVTAWTRLHGLVSLEIEGVLEQMGIDGARLLAAEVERLIVERAPSRPPAP